MQQDESGCIQLSRLEKRRDRVVQQVVDLLEELSAKDPTAFADACNEVQSLLDQQRRIKYPQLRQCTKCSKWFSLTTVETTTEEKANAVTVMDPYRGVQVLANHLFKYYYHVCPYCSFLNLSTYEDLGALKVPEDWCIDK